MCMYACICTHAYVCVHACTESCTAWPEHVGLPHVPLDVQSLINMRLKAKLLLPKLNDGWLSKMITSMAFQSLDGLDNDISFYQDRPTAGAHNILHKHRTQDNTAHQISDYFDKVQQEDPSFMYRLHRDSTGDPIGFAW